MSDNSEADELHTLSIGVKRKLAASEGRSSGQSTPKKPSHRSRVKGQDYRDFVPRGTTFSKSEKEMSTQSENQSETPTHTSTASSIPMGKSWNQDPVGPIRTSLRGSGHVGKNRLATGFPKQLPHKLDVEPGLTRTSSAQLSSGECPDDAIEISDGTDVESDSEGGMMINVDAQESRPGPRRLLESDDNMEDGEMLSSGQITASQISSPTSSQKSDGAHKQLQDGLRCASITKLTPNGIVGPDPSRRRLADLNPDDLDKQIKYTLFHLSREQIDLNRLVICTACLQEGHLDESCPERNCTHCSAQGDHASRQCPQFRRCTKCRERGHNVSACNSKLRDVSIPCENCGSENHLEDTCSMRFFPTRTIEKNTEFKLWVSCCNCASNTHLVGDCPAIDPDQAPNWTLRSLDSRQITNMSLESGTGKRVREAINRGMRPERLKIKGRAEIHRTGELHGDDSSLLDDEPFLRPPVGRQRPPPGSGQMQSGRGNDRRRRIQIEPVRRNDGRHGPQGSSQHRDSSYATDSFGNSRRSRSPEPDRFPDGYGSSHRRESPPRYQNSAGGDHWDSRSNDPFRRPADREQIDNYRLNHRLPRRPNAPPPPLPREPLPNRPPSPYSGQRVQLPSRQGTNEWVNTQSNVPTVTAADFRPTAQQRQQQPAGKSRGNRGGKGRNNQNTNGNNGGGGQSKPSRKPKGLVNPSRRDP